MTPSASLVLPARGPRPALRWRVTVALISLLTLVPLAVIVPAVFNPDPQIWAHLLDYLLPQLLLNTLYLVVGVGAGVLLIGVSLAWLVSVYDFPGRRFFNWALMLPLAMPAYVLGFSQLGLFDYTGPVQTLARALVGRSDWVPSISSTPGVILVLTLSFYPYVYLLARGAFATQGRRALEVGQALGLSRRAGFWRVALPLARPWIVGGLMLALMETLADFGTVSLLNFDAFTSAIYKAWFSFFSLDTAKQLASMLVFMVFVLAAFEQRARGRRAYAQSGRSAPLPRLPLSGAGGTLAALAASLVLLLAFVLPFGQIVWWAYSAWADELNLALLGYALHSLALSALAALLVAVVALLLAYAVRRDGSGWNRLLSRIATLGYAVPGTVLAVGLFVPVAYLDGVLLALLQPWLPAGTSALLKGSLLVLLLAYLARFLAVGHASVDAAMHRITRSQEEAARNMGVTGWALVRRLHLPLLRRGLFTALLMVFVDVMKEMPITLMTRPFGWDTLAVRIFTLTSEGEWERAALPAVVIVLAGLLPVILLSREDETK